MMMMRASFGDNMHLVPRALHPTAQKALDLGTAGRLYPAAHRLKT